MLVAAKSVKKSLHDQICQLNYDVSAIYFERYLLELVPQERLPPAPGHPRTWQVCFPQLASAEPEPEREVVLLLRRRRHPSCWTSGRFGAASSQSSGAAAASAAGAAFA